MEFQTPPRKRSEIFFPPKPNSNEFRKKLDITKCPCVILKFDEDKEDDGEKRKNMIFLKIKKKHAVKN